MSDRNDDDPDDRGVDYRPDKEVPTTPAEAARRKAEDTLLLLPGVNGVGIGRTAAGDDAIILYIRDPSVSASLPATIDGIVVIAEVVGDITPLGKE